MDGIKPGASTVAVGSNYLNTTFNPGPGKYNCEGAFSPFYSEVLKNKDDDTSFFTVSICLTGGSSQEGLSGSRQIGPRDSPLMTPHIRNL